MSKVEYTNSIKQQIKTDNGKAIKFYFNSIKMMDQDIKIQYRHINILNPVFTISLNDEYLKSISVKFIYVSPNSKQADYYKTFNELYDYMMVIYWTIKAATKNKED